MFVISAIFVGFALALAGHWVLKGSRHSLSVGFCVLIASIFGGLTWREMRLEAELADVVAIVSGVPAAAVECQGFLREFRLDNNLGEVAFDGNGGVSRTAQLRGSVCDQIRDWRGAGFGVDNRDQVVAVHVLSHEAIHVSGVTSEARTECLAMQSNAQSAELLGATPQQARALAETYWEDVFPRMPGTYRASDCYEGGELDQTPGDGIWP